MLNLKDVKFRPLSGLKKTIVYSSEKEKAFVEGALNILSATEKKTPSAILEDIVESYLLPVHADAKAICKDLYSSETNVFGALYSVFDWYAAGTNFQARWSNGYPLVDYLHSQLAFCDFPLGDKKASSDRQYFYSNFFQLYKLIEASYHTDHEDILTVIESPVKYCRFHFDAASSEDGSFVPINLTNIIRKHWDILGNNTYTYRTLSALCRLYIPYRTDYAEDRLKLIHIISAVSKEWD